MVSDILFHVLPTGVGEVLSVSRTVVLSSRLLHEVGREAHGTWTIRPYALDATGVHLFKPNDKYTIGRSILHQRPGQMQPRRPSRTCIVGVVNRNGCHAKLIENALTRSRIALCRANGNHQ